MSEQDATNGNAATPAAGADNTPGSPVFTVEKIYMKDVSFEAPGAPQVFNEQGQPQLQMNLNQKVQRLGDNTFEVMVTQDGKPVTDAMVSTEFYMPAMPSMNMPEMRTKTTSRTRQWNVPRQGPGHERWQLGRHRHSDARRTRDR